MDIVHVPFNGSPPAVTATIQGETQMMFAVMQPLQAADPGRQASRHRRDHVKTLSVAAGPADHRRSRVSGFEALAWNGILAPAGTPKPIITRLNAEINAVLKMPDVVQKLNAAGFDIIGGPPEDLSLLIKGRGSAMGAGHQEERHQGRLKPQEWKERT